MRSTGQIKQKGGVEGESGTWSHNQRFASPGTRGEKQLQQVGPVCLARYVCR
jgi:hypothetical protein